MQFLKRQKVDGKDVRLDIPFDKKTIGDIITSLKESS